MTARVFGSGIRRREDPRLLTGTAQYTDDLKLPRMACAAFLRSTQAHARIRKLDVSAARKAPGVVAAFTGADVDAIALAAVRATREATVARGGEMLPAIIGTPLAGEVAAGETFDGVAEVASFPGDLPDNPDILFDPIALKGLTAAPVDEADFRFLRFRPPQPESGPWADAALPHIRLDRALQFLIGDRLA